MLAISISQRLPADLAGAVPALAGFFDDGGIAGPAAIFADGGLAADGAFIHSSSGENILSHSNSFRAIFHFQRLFFSLAHH